jgi:hypothetical protein
MSTQLNLKEIERRAFRSTYQDGLWDLYFGLIVICVSFFIYRPASGYSPMNIILMTCTMVVAYGLFWAGKKFITLPRMGQVRFGEQRKKRRRTMIIVLGALVLIQVVFLSLQLWAWANPEMGKNINRFLADKNIMDLAVASIGALMVGTGMLLAAFFTDFPRGYYIALMFSLAVFLMIYLNQPVYPIIIGILIAIPGLVLLVRFLKKYPLSRVDGSNV